ncbi:uncharacterized protein N7479_002179 [Penicillium vulpinum]|uniref:PBP domain-containing protein n=1 Tax=Penicillium vulpinum TaxID=29845 RepID=A0A1V6S7H7_9EURO|nr:uncharacterized protein N7479_002179 [Penicillium vulpinum]KAJ5972261.1 hypothetical protein N7479_002179 [Penicillium vulpinum]OQE10011.1 hypothetical protein PENVUL_c005G01345 [Penicillium vulpinum]
MRSFTALMQGLALATFAHAVDPAAIYSGGYNASSEVLLRIGNGGAGQSGLIGVLADAFIRSSVQNGSTPFKVAWYKSDTTESIKYLKSNTVDIGITYAPAAEQIAITQAIAKSPAWYAWRDHFLLTGPPSNPANLSNTTDIKTMFSQIFSAAENGTSSPPVRFLSRYDKSATNIKDSQLWIEIGQVPWATAYSTWYHQYISYPIQALTAAILLDEYTITDRGTFLSIDAGLQNQTIVYKAATDAPEDPLLNPAHMLVGRGASNEIMADRFAQWVIGLEGQRAIVGFRKNGQQLYTAAPINKTALF